MFDTDSHRLIMLQILKSIYTDMFLQNFLGFKGGTATYFLYQLPRFSVDLDFDLLDPAESEEVFRKMELLLSRYGQVREKRIKRFTLFFLLSYKKHGRNMKIEISKRVFPNRYELKSLLGLPVKTLVKEDIFAHKLVTLMERKEVANRDLYDIWFFLDHRWDVNTPLVEFRMRMPFPTFVEKCLQRIEAVNQRYILQGLGELLDEKQKK